MVGADNESHVPPERFVVKGDNGKLAVTPVHIVKTSAQLNPVRVEQGVCQHANVLGFKFKIGVKAFADAGVNQIPESPEGPDGTDPSAGPADPRPRRNYWAYKVYPQQPRTLLPNFFDGYNG